MKTVGWLEETFWDSVISTMPMENLLTYQSQWMAEMTNVQ